MTSSPQARPPPADLLTSAQVTSPAPSAGGRTSTGLSHRESRLAVKGGQRSLDRLGGFVVVPDGGGQPSSRRAGPRSTCSIQPQADLSGHWPARPSPIQIPG